MSSLTTSTFASPITTLSSPIHYQGQPNCYLPLGGLRPLPTQFQTSLQFKKQPIRHVTRLKSASVICASAALNARCAAEQTQTVTRESSTITVAPIQGKEKSPDLDDGGDGFPPRDDGDGGGGGGGGGGGWKGGFFFFGFLAFLGLLKDKESEGDYGDSRSRRRR
ncbi:protein FERTILITY RESTORER RF2, mitochondrial [Impatiens glandulifera]|uniref:protein FERTILITY RESTORER RF2, mitochondrial n=1 Tax=Impatiens glandulifera TaxID=253017 RepID=UPI001FB095C4|nr:protein FERTILITY RESTORER RF2, mitochondrial [Impatiens glandulifera]XP_047342334.1 protein FERTILITY RESTORER RF2, mitochondrial [Impatiens glandulifera]